MKKFSKSAFLTTIALICYTGFATAQVVNFDKPSDLVNDLKFGGPGGPGGHGGFGGGGQPHPNPPAPEHGGFNGGDHNGPGHNDHGGFNGGDHNGPGHDDHGGFNGGDHNGPGHDDHGGWNGGDHNGPGHHDGPGPIPGPWHPQPDPWHPQPGPWHPQPGPQPGPWHPGPGNNNWHPHQDGHPDWDHNDWGNNHWNHHDIGHNDWWNNYDYWWTASVHPYSLYRTVCNVLPGNSAKGFIVEETMPFNGTATFYYYNAFDTLLGSGIPASGMFRGGDGTPIMNYYQMPFAVDHCFMAITQ